MKVAVIGATGWVGKGMMELFPDAYRYTSKIGTKAKVNKCDIAFICVPTPLSESGRLDTSIVEEIIKWCECSLIVIRSTVNPGDCDRWAKRFNKNIVMQPEYLGETPSHPLLDTTQTNFIILGGKKEDTNKVIDLYATTYNANTKIRQVTALEAEIIKLTENRAIAYKVMQCHELYLVCQKAGVDYYTIRDAVYGDDPRFNLWFTFIYPEKLGFMSSKCLRKDVPAWNAWAKSVGFDPELTIMLFVKSGEYGRL